MITRVELKKKKTTEVAAEIRRLATLYMVPMSNVVIDEDGIGGGVVDLLPGCIGFVANSSPLHQKPGESYRNLKSQCAFKLADIINANGVFEQAEAVVQDYLTQDLEQIKQKHFDKQIPKEIVSKDVVKELLGRSPDEGDTYIMRAYFEVAKPKGLIIS